MAQTSCAFAVVNNDLIIFKNVFPFEHGAVLADGLLCSLLAKPWPGWEAARGRVTLV